MGWSGIASCDGRKGVCRRQISVMVKRITLFRIICFCLLAACGASCQSEPALGGELRGLQFRSTDRQRQERGAWRSSPDAPLPDAPMPNALAPESAQFQTDRFRGPGTQPRVLFSVGAANAGVFRETQAANLAPLFPPRGAALFYNAAERAVPAQKDLGFFLDKYLYPPTTLPQGSRYQASSSDGLLGRATDAASRILLTCDQSGKRRFNTAYFLRLATSVAADSASRKYRAHSKTAPLSDFGSNVGNDAGMNLFHEFGPDLGQAVTSHLPKFVSRIEGLILPQNPRGQSPHNPNPRAGGGMPTR